MCLYVDSLLSCSRFSELLNIDIFHHFWKFLSIQHFKIISLWISVPLSFLYFWNSKKTYIKLYCYLLSLFWVSSFDFVFFILEYFSICEVILNLWLILFFSIVVFFRSRIFIWLFYKIAMSIFIASSSMSSFYNFVFIVSNTIIFIVL